MRLSAMEVPPHGAIRLIRLHVVRSLEFGGELFLTEDPQRGRRDPLRGEPEMLEHFASGTRCAVAIDTDDGAALPDEAIPAEGGARLDRDARRPDRSEHALAVGIVLLIKQLPRGHADHSSADALLAEQSDGADGEIDLRPSADEHNVRVSFSGNDVRPIGDRAPGTGA